MGPRQTASSEIGCRLAGVKVNPGQKLSLRLVTHTLESADHASIKVPDVLNYAERRVHMFAHLDLADDQAWTESLRPRS